MNINQICLTPNFAILASKAMCRIFFYLKYYYRAATDGYLLYPVRTNNYLINILKFIYFTNVGKESVKGERA